MRSAALVAGMRERYLYNTLVGKPEEKGQLGRSGRKWKDNIKICLQKIEWERVCVAYAGEEGYIQRFGGEM